VATGTVGRRSERAVIHAFGRQPTGRAVATVTRRLGWPVVGRLARCLAAVVTGGARSGGNTDVVELGTAEGLRRMAGFTRGRGWDVHLRFDHVAARQTQPAGMTSSAVPRSAFENTVDVTRLTARSRMHALKCKPRLQMVKVARHTLRCCKSPQCQQRKRQRPPNRPAP